MRHDTLKLDWDVKEKTLKARLNKVRSLLGKVEIRIYETEHGFHVEFPNIKSDIILRKYLYDDPDRIRVAKKRKEEGMYDYIPDLLSDRDGKDKIRRKRREDLEEFYHSMNFA